MKTKIEPVFVKGNEALAMGAIDAGVKYYFGYPITPQSDIPEFLSREFPKLGATFLQAESEIASINMLLGATSTGARAMTSSSSPGISLKMEGISFLAGSELPGLIINITRSGPGLGGIAPTQGDYFQATKGGGHGDYRLIVLGPSSVQEMYDLVFTAIRLSEKYRNPAMILADALLGQMKEPLIRNKSIDDLPEIPKPWATIGTRGVKSPVLIKSLYLNDGELEAHNLHLLSKYRQMEAEETLIEEILPSGKLDIILCAFGSAARIAKTVLKIGRENGITIGLLRPISLFPFPKKQIKLGTGRCKDILVVELNTGQMVEDVMLNADRDAEIHFYGRPGGLPTPEEIFEKVQAIVKK